MQVNPEYESEINLKDLFFHVLYRWRSILLVALVFAVALGGFKFISLKSSQDKTQLSKEEQLEFQADTISLTSYQSQVESLTRMLEDQSRYQTESIYFRLDSQSVWVASAKFLVKVDPSILASLPQGSSLDPADNILGAYVYPLASSGEDELMAAFGTGNPAYAAELVTITTDPATNAIDLSVKGSTRENAERGLAYVQEKLIALTEDAQKIDPHTLILIGRNTVQTTDNDLVKVQRDLYKSIIDNQTSLEAAQQKVSELEESGKVEAGLSTRAILKQALKWAIIGFVIGAFLLAGLYLVLFVLRGTLSGGDDLSVQYHLPVLGEFEKSASIHGGKGLDKLLAKMEGVGKEPASVLYDRIAALISQKSEIKTLTLLSTLPAEKLADLRKELSSRLPVLTVESEGDYLRNGEAISKAAASDAIVLVEERDVSKNKAIDSMIKALLISKANVLGAVVI